MDQPAHFRRGGGRHGRLIELRRMIRQGLINTALALASAALALGLLFAGGELLLRAMYGSVPPGPPTSWSKFDEGRGWTMKPGRYSYFEVRAARRVDVTINKLGLRQGALAPEPPAGVERISVVGDSFIFGPPVDDAETIPARLQALAGDRYEVVNISAPGYGTAQQYRLIEELRARGYKLGSKVVLSFFTNDVQDNLALDYATLAPNPRQPAFAVDAAGELKQVSAPVAAKPRKRGGGRAGLLERSLFASYVRYQLDVLAVSYPGMVSALRTLGMVPGLPRTPGIVLGWHSPEWQEHWQVSARVLEYVVKQLRALPEAPEVYIAFMPSPFQVHETFQRALASGANGDPRYASYLADPDRPQRMVRELAARLNVPFIDITPAVRAAGARAPMYYPREGHFNEAGGRVAAEVLYERVILAGARQAGEPPLRYGVEANRVPPPAH